MPAAGFLVVAALWWWLLLRAASHSVAHSRVVQIAHCLLLSWPLPFSNFSYLCLLVLLSLSSSWLSAVQSGHAVVFAVVGFAVAAVSIVRRLSAVGSTTLVRVCAAVVTLLEAHNLQW